MAVEQATAQEVFDGVMLSDGSIHHNGNDYFDIQLSGKEHLDWLNDIKTSLMSLGFEVSDNQPKVYNAFSRGKAYKRVVLRSLSSPAMGLQYYRWYQNRIKTVPAGLVLTPGIIAHWFMGDGSSSWRKWHSSSRNQNAVRIRFCTQGFSDNDVHRLTCMLLHMGILGHTERNKSGQVITVVNTDSIISLIKMIEPYVLPSYQHKIKKPWKIIKYPARRTAGFDSLRVKLRR